ncbi:SCP2 sterol-binding domain-containing protein [Natronococcus wangiae]|uniref:SCP2 sterol-binding domain-containing protein n=1 Tax=Natronococcus wangiae TaxID=3068275 RepID=UPI00273E674C|nr:SCP2 sterol-binding domain-containing protein [Natronococcus sp. AD5]
MSTHQLRPIEQYFPTQPWLEEYRAAINESDEYGESSAGWGVDFDGSFIFQIEDVPIETTTMTDLPSEIADAIDDELSARSDDRIEDLLEDAPPAVRESVEAREGSLEERVTEEIQGTTMAELPDRIWPELRAELPDLIDDLITQLEENMADDGTIYAYLDLYDGDCRAVDTITDLDEREYGFRLAGEYEKWTKLVRGEGDVINMLMSGELELDGDMQKILQYSDAAVDLAEISADVESRFIF